MHGGTRDEVCRHDPVQDSAGWVASRSQAGEAAREEDKAFLLQASQQIGM